MKYLDLLGPCIDKFGLITQTAEDNWDGGDTTQREGMFSIAVECLHDLKMISDEDYVVLNKRYRDNISKLNCCPGNLRRHVDPTMWYSDCDRMSRDQWTPNVIAMGMMGMDSERKNMLIGHLKRALLFTTNTRNNYAYSPSSPKHDATQDYNWKIPDLTVLSCWGYHIRSFKAKILYPILLITDLDLLVNSLIWIYRFKTNSTNTDILNHTCSLIQARKSMPTPISWIARKILSADKVLQRLQSYFSNMGPRLDLVYADFLKQIW